ncbi:hypothetical protein [Sinorhizobium meliloti]|uniref:hypothetical protein n=1 Tax=Rhizobium meliloti TaxID=382 RepID=UPI0012958701|nr:hypothetical protein [Sinorhizobium meliloti]MQX33283.1 hypothetical protein [Sinorhizobium meliloti]
MSKTSETPSRSLEAAIRSWRYGRIYRHSPLDRFRVLPRSRTFGAPFEPRHERLLRKWLTEQGFNDIDEHDLNRALLRVSLDPLPRRQPSEALIRRCRALCQKLIVIPREPNNGR